MTDEAGENRKARKAATYTKTGGSGGKIALQEISRQKAILKNRIAPEIEEAVAAMAIEFPAYGQVRVSNELKKRGTLIRFCLSFYILFDHPQPLHLFVIEFKRAGLFGEHPTLKVAVDGFLVCGQVLINAANALDESYKRG